MNVNWMNLLQQLLPTAIGIAEQIHGAKTGPQKLNTVITIAQTVLGIASAAGAIPATSFPNTVAISQAANAQVAAMNTSGQLPK